MLESYAGAKVLVEGIKRAGPNPTRQKLRDALETLRRFGLGGLELSDSPSDHTGLEHVDLHPEAPQAHRDQPPTMGELP